MAAFREVVEASRPAADVIHLGLGQDITDPDSFLALEVFEDRAALDRQDSLPATQRAIALLPELVAAEPKATIYHVSSSEPLGVGSVRRVRHQALTLPR
jgi:quinol monooxygenase YgiN